MFTLSGLLIIYQPREAKQYFKRFFFGELNMRRADSFTTLIVRVHNYLDYKKEGLVFLGVE